MAGDHCQNYLPYHFDFRRFFFLATLAHVSFVPKSRLFFFLEGGGGGGGGVWGVWGKDSPGSDHQLLPIPIFRASVACQR